jgi:hypothetical protein
MSDVTDVKTDKIRFEKAADTIVILVLKCPERLLLKLIRLSYVPWIKDG